MRSEWLESNSYITLLLLKVIYYLASVPRAPEIDVNSCAVRDNTIMVAWRPACEADPVGDVGTSGPIEHYELEYRKTNSDSSLRAAGGACWEKIHDIREAHVTVSGQRSRQPHLDLA